MTKRNSNFSESVDSQNSGPTMNFLGDFKLTRDQFCLTSQYVLDKCMHTASMHNISSDISFSDV